MEKMYVDVYEWDYENWAKSLNIWKPILKTEKPLKCLEIGARRGGLSLLIASYGHSVICTDLNNPIDTASELHAKYGVSNLVQYSAVDLTNIPFENEFDIIAFKSVLGGVARHNDLEKAKKLALELKKALKPGGKILFAENCAGSIFHKLARTKLRKWGNSWSYFSMNQYNEIFSDFNEVIMESYGFWSAFAIGPISRKMLSLLDRLTNYFIPAREKYIVYGVATKLKVAILTLAICGASFSTEYSFFT